MSGAVLPSRLAAWLGYGVSIPLAERLIANVPLRPQLDALITARLGAAGPADAAQVRALAMDPAALRRLALQAGAVWHGAAIAALLDGEQVRALVASIGAELRALALAGRDLAGAARATTPEAIAEAIPLAGGACLAAWLDAQPAAIAERLALRTRDTRIPAGYPADPAIVSWLLEQPERPA